MGSPLKSWFRSSTAYPGEAQPDAAADAGERVTKRAQVAGLLERIRKARCLLNVRVPGERQLFSSMLLRVSSLDDYLLIDELVPRYGNELMREELEVTVSAFLQGVIYEAAAQVIAVGEENNVPIFRLELPPALAVMQRRQHHRVELPAGASMPVHCTVGSNRLVRGEVQNISLGGLCFQVDKRQARDMNVGAVIKRCVIEPRPEMRIVATVQVRNASPPTTQSNIRRVGVRFLDMDKPAQAALHQLVIALERAEVQEHRRML